MQAAADAIDNNNVVELHSRRNRAGEPLAPGSGPASSDIAPAGPAGTIAAGPDGIDPDPQPMAMAASLGKPAAFSGADQNDPKAVRSQKEQLRSLTDHMLKETWSVTVDELKTVDGKIRQATQSSNAHPHSGDLQRRSSLKVGKTALQEEMRSRGIEFNTENQTQTPDRKRKTGPKR